jgi:PIN domain nuclease of toxin-antitoxin system
LTPILFDTNSFIWFSNLAPIRPTAYAALIEAQQADRLFISPICVWELAFAARKNHPLRRPDLRGMTPREFFDEGVLRLNITVLPITTDIASASADIAPLYGSGDPGDCFFLATAHLHSLTLITRDARILAFAQANPTYLTAIQC